MEFLTVKEFVGELKKLNVHVTEKMIRNYIAAGNIRAVKERIRPSRWAIHQSELHRIVNLD